MSEPIIDTYSCAELDKKLDDLKEEMLDNIGKAIIMADSQTGQSLDHTSLFMKIESVEENP